MPLHLEPQRHTNLVQCRGQERGRANARMVNYGPDVGHPTGGELEGLLAPGPDDVGPSSLMYVVSLGQSGTDPANDLVPSDLVDTRLDTGPGFTRVHADQLLGPVLHPARSTTHQPERGLVQVAFGRCAIKLESCHLR